MTAMQKMVDTLKNDWNSPQQYINLAEYLLELEKQQIIDAYNQCQRNTFQSNPEICFKTGEQYFKETFEDAKGNN